MHIEASMGIALSSTHEYRFFNAPAAGRCSDVYSQAQTQQHMSSISLNWTLILRVV